MRSEASDGPLTHAIVAPEREPVGRRVSMLGPTALSGGGTADPLPFDCVQQRYLKLARRDEVPEGSAVGVGPPRH